MLVTNSEPSFWGEIFPAYLGALGGIASAVVAALAFLLGLRTKRSVASVKEVLEPEEQSRVEPVHAPKSAVPPHDRLAAPSQVEGEPEGGDIGETVAHGYLAGENPPDSEPWTVMRQVKSDGRRRDLALANSSDRPLTLIGIELFNGNEWIPAFLPETSEIKPQEARYFDFKLLGGRESNINVVQVVWIDADRRIRNQRVLL